MPFIISRITSGLGNQLFQYAYGQKLATSLHREHRVDTSWFDFFQPHNPKRVFHLKTLNLPQTTEYTEGPFRWLTGLATTNNASIQGLLQTALKPCGLDFINERTTSASSVQKEMIRPDRHLVVNGYWQSWKSVAEAIPEMRRHILDNWLFSDTAAPILQQMRTTRSAFIHIRRGDYAQWNIPMLDVAYYQAATDRLSQELGGGIRWYIFSEDIEWCQKNLTFLKDIQFVNLNSPQRDIEDLLLMAECQAGIIANSSFSWWAASLGTEHRLIVAPSHWLDWRTRQADDFYAPSWHIQDVVRTSTNLS